MSEPIRRRVVLAGQVQGVFFRDSCRSRAEQQGLSGFVRNLPDGRVEAAFEGPPDAVDLLVSWCRRGPRRAKVSYLEIVDEEPLGEIGFRVLA
jgi:acylphosphatase